MEICGVLIGRKENGRTIVTGAVAGEGAAHGGSHVTFTQQAWVAIHEEKNRLYPGQSIVGWYHSHPGFGVFLSDHDFFIHQNFFSEAGSLAWVYDPQSDEEGCFGWDGNDINSVERFEIIGGGKTKAARRREASTTREIDNDTIPIDITPDQPTKNHFFHFVVVLAVILGLCAGFLLPQVISRVKKILSVTRNPQAPEGATYDSAHKDGSSPGKTGGR